MSRRTIILLVLVLVLAATVRVIFSAGVVGMNALTDGDEMDYHTIAEHIAAGDGFVTSPGQPTARRAPLFPLLLSLVYLVSDGHRAVAHVVQLFLGLLVVLLAFVVARRFLDDASALVAAALVALNPLLIFITGYVLTENLYMVLVLGALALVPTPAAATRSWRRLAAVAALLALSALTRPSGVALAVWMVVAVALFGAGRSWPWRLVQGMVAIAIFFAVVTPWVLRNQHALGDNVGITSHGGITFLQGNNPKIISIPHYRGGVAPVDALPRAGELARMSEAERNRFAYKMGLQFLRHNWRDAPRVVWWKFHRMWRLRSDVGLSGIRSGWWFNRATPLGRIAANFDAGFIYAVIVFPLFLVGVVSSARRWREYLFLYGVIVAHTAITIVYFGSLRMRIPVEPVIAIFAAAGIANIISRARRRRVDPAPATALR